MKVRLLVALAAVGAAAFVAAGSAGAATNHICNNDVLASGSYLNVTVSGVCTLTSSSSGLVDIKGNLHVTGGAVFNASGCAFFSVAGGAQVDAGAVFILDGSCETKAINRGVAFDNATSLFINNAVFHSGGIISNGGGGSAANPCGRHDVPITGAPIAEVEDSDIAGNLTFNGYHGCFLDIFANTIGGSASLVGNAVQDSNVLAVNLILGNLFCKFNQPPPTLDGFAENVVLGTVNPSACVPLVL